MDRIDGDNHIDIGGGRRGFRDRSALAGVPGTELTADWHNGVQEELLKVVEAAGIVPDDGDWTQLWQALKLLHAPAAPAYWYLEGPSGSLPHNVETQIGSFASSTSRGALTINATTGAVTIGAGGGGLYLIEAGYNALLVNTATRVWIRINGVWARTQGGAESGGSELLDQSATLIARLAAGDVVTSRFFQTNASSSSRAMSGSFSGFRIGD